jgi:hypothetical protein
MVSLGSPRGRSSRFLALTPLHLRCHRLRLAGGLAPCRLSDQGAQAALERVGADRIGSRDVVLLLGILRQIVQLAARRENELELPVADRRELTPSVVVPRIPGFGQSKQLDRLAVECGPQRLALHVRRDLDAGQLEHRWHHVHDADLVGNDARLDTGTADDERYLDRGVVDEESVLLLAVFAELFAMIAEHDHESVIQRPGGAERVDQAPDLPIDEGHLGVVGAEARPGELLCHFRGRIVRRVDIVEVYPGKERVGVCLLQPREGTVDHLVSRTLDRVQAGTNVL